MYFPLFVYQTNFNIVLINLIQHEVSFKLFSEAVERSSILERFWKICLCLCLSPTRNGQIDINICFGSRPFGAAQICLCLTMSISHLLKILRTHGTHLVEAGLLDDDDLAILLYWTSLRGPRILHDYYLHVNRRHFKHFCVVGCLSHANQ